LLKADAAQRLVYGRIDETPDRVGEVFDYATSKPYFEKWSANAETASGGKSKGNLRAMHGNVAAGIIQDIAFDDAAKAIDFCVHVVDDAEWAKVEAGVYTGFSPGGRYKKRWKDGDHQRYTAEPSEISLVDLPCIPSATFSLVKADGIAEDRTFRAPDLGDLVKMLSEASSVGDVRSIVLALGSDQLTRAFGVDGAHAPELDGFTKRDFSARFLRCPAQEVSR
jgi:hypothetical protein